MSIISDFTEGDIVRFATGRTLWRVVYVHGDGNVSLSSLNGRVSQPGTFWASANRHYVHPRRLVRTNLPKD